MADITTHRRMTAMRVYELIAATAQRNEPTPSYMAIQHELNLSYSTVQRAIWDLEDEIGWLTRERDASNRVAYVTMTGARTTPAVQIGGSGSQRGVVQKQPERKCLSCRKTFKPEHKNNYLCAPCGRRAANASPYASGGWLHTSGRV